MSGKYLVVIGGATATGKTAMAIRVARHFVAEIISADSRQFYREMNIGTAKPKLEELSSVPHHFINSLSINEDYNIGRFEKEALECVRMLHEKNDIVVMTGGSGLYIDAVCYGLDEFPYVSENVVKELDKLYNESGIEVLQEELKSSDPEYYSKVDKQNPQRLLRALAICRATGKPYSGFLSESKKSRPFKPILILLEMSREELYKRINKRVDLMMEKGLLEEVKSLVPFRHNNSLATVGYQELFGFIDGNISLERAVELIKQNSRRYAKRQMTWFRNKRDWVSFFPDDIDGVIDFIESEVG